MNRRFSAIEEHLLKWHTPILLDTMAEWDHVSHKGRVHQYKTGPYHKQFISVQGSWRIEPDIVKWLEEMGIEYTLRLDSTKDPYKWFLVFSDKGHAALFKLKWVGV